LSGDVRFKKAFEESWKINLQRMGQIARLSAMLTPEQKVAFKKISRSIKKLGPSLNKIVHIRSNGKWNIANLWLGEKAAPAASEIKVRLNTMTESQNSLLQEDMDAISSETHRLIILLIISFFVGALISGVLGSAITQAVSRPIKNVSHMARELAAGNLRQKKLPVESRDELGDLSESFNQLLDRLKKIQPFGKPLSK
ncbi:MAG: HAMP domain-containing protein, partial [candidate division Zixibacteria bacterium]|nr:HAMP domain-containing protein [candidate division KSB1 bacterium]NIS47442.1 HAMP domain-containing protein [candidate division Zixibacteria bacterium]NIV07664.1 HAMP domain-containing protein [candidate division Zixibacteria bacterium]NIW70171.1 HAMP domain-containing protein [candidate division KSB1 bacterium]